MFTTAASLSGIRAGLSTGYFGVHFADATGTGESGWHSAIAAASCRPSVSTIESESESGTPKLQTAEKFLQDRRGGSGGQQPKSKKSEMFSKHFKQLKKYFLFLKLTF